MTRPNRPKYAARLNAFKALTSGKASVVDMIEGAAQVGGLDAADLNYPDHFSDHTSAQLSHHLSDAGMALNGLAMRYYTDPGFKLGAFTHPDAAVRQAAIDLTKRGIDACADMGGSLITLWMGQDGFDYAFQMDYARAWDDTVDAIAQVCDHVPGVDIAIEYKPNEPRAFALMPDIGTTLLAVKEVARPNLGVTLDFAHVLYADEMPAHSAHLIARHSHLMGLHLNDGYGKRDDGLMAGTVHPIQTVELLVEMIRQGYDGVIYFDTFPDMGGLNPIEEARTNIALVERLRGVAATLVDDADLAAAISRQDAALSSRIVARALYGA
ncbi:sugar phosphate isomerase/epimerase family protein [Parasulfitobacter algicola]|uniref:Xylose isomerase n=1 Tax=Parasulfitobacter algicola TaxID=2614809 RepID=A0ABX2J1A5_9RHOB|nr:sugar phosphate isomerase/epimerase family protein [Sulfitobacter algicola]NSX56648.1 TIM barrel protein [Sulfitobacter algicola]